MIGRIARNQTPREGAPAVKVSYAGPGRGHLFVMGDPQKLARVVENLIDNARSFSPEGGRVRLIVEPVGDKVQVAVEDDGPGVPPDERDYIFRRFHSVRPERDGFGKHSGLGLAIASTILEGHHGVIWVEDRREDKPGARFVFTLPLSVPRTEATMTS
jgi:two-component system sensor histidine kinase ChvG